MDSIIQKVKECLIYKTSEIVFKINTASNAYCTLGTLIFVLLSKRKGCIKSDAIRSAATNFSRGGGEASLKFTAPFHHTTIDFVA